MSIRLIVGLGNPGAEYADTRHNVGYTFIEQLCEQSRQAFTLETKFKGAVATLNIAEQTVRILKPSTFMNESGQSVLLFKNFYKLSAEQILIVHDDLDLPTGTVRLKSDGGHGGHNGLRDIIARLGTTAFYRLRLGIGHPGNKSQVHNYVLHRPSLSDQKHIQTAIQNALFVMPDLIKNNLEKAMQTLHTAS